ncbi:MAG: restriction endonuclease [Candidatus Sulfotelmatobacter sp.]
MVKPWQEYQYRTAELLQQLGWEAEPDDPIRAPNGVVHRVDVSARMMLAGVPVLWIVECKLWNRPVPKEKISALKDIVNDLGADRGLLMSEKGFQAGAMRLAATKNITLSSFANLAAIAAEQLLEPRIRYAEDWLRPCERTAAPGVGDFGPATRVLLTWAKLLPYADHLEFARRSTAFPYSEGIAELRARVGIDESEPNLHEVLLNQQQEFVARDPSRVANPWQWAVHLATALMLGRRRQWPVPVKAVDGPKLAWSMTQLLPLVETAIPLVDQLIDARVGVRSVGDFRPGPQATQP